MGECQSSQNISTNSTKDQLSGDASEYLKFIFYGIVAPIIIILGIFGNILSLCILRMPILKGATYIYLKWLAISDIMSLLFYITFSLRKLGYQLRSYTAAVYYAHFELTLLNGFMASSMFLIVSLTVDRYFSICLPAKFLNIHNKKKAYCAITSSYICAFILYLPLFFIKYADIDTQTLEITEYIPFTNKCLIAHQAFHMYVAVKELCVRIGPILALAILNTQIIIAFKHAMKKRKELQHVGNETSEDSAKFGSIKHVEEKKLIHMLIGIMVLTFTCKIPGAINGIIAKHVDKTSFRMLLFGSIADSLEVLNHGLNFCIYCLCSSQYRKAFLTLVSCFHLTHTFSYEGRTSSTSTKSRKDVTIAHD